MRNTQKNAPLEKRETQLCPIAAYEQSSSGFAFDLALRLLFI